MPEPITAVGPRLIRLCSSSTATGPGLAMLQNGFSSVAVYMSRLSFRTDRSCRFSDLRACTCVTSSPGMVTRGRTGATTAGLQRVDVIYRRIDDDFLDPVHFR